jgi:hypothetical protein
MADEAGYEALADLALFRGDLVPCCEGDHETMTLEEASSYIRAAYGRGYVDALEEPGLSILEAGRMADALYAVLPIE